MQFIRKSLNKKYRSIQKILKQLNLVYIWQCITKKKCTNIWKYQYYVTKITLKAINKL